MNPFVLIAFGAVTLAASLFVFAIGFFAVLEKFPRWKDAWRKRDVKSESPKEKEVSTVYTSQIGQFTVSEPAPSIFRGWSSAGTVGTFLNSSYAIGVPADPSIISSNTDVIVSGFSGYSGINGRGGFSGFSGQSGFSGGSGFSGISGWEQNQHRWRISSEVTEQPPAVAYSSDSPPKEEKPLAKKPRILDVDEGL